MSTTTQDIGLSLDIREQVARIDRSIAETAKFSAEQAKLSAEASKLRMDRFYAPLVILASFTSALLGAGGLALIQAILKAKGG